MSEAHLFLSLAAFFVVAFLYASIGHAGASGYLAIMALLAYPVESIKPVSLLMNCTVAMVATAQFARASHFSPRLFWPFAVTSLPLAFLGGRLHLDPASFRILAGVFLVAASALMFAKNRIQATPQSRRLHLPSALLLGGAIGLLSGVVGVGGGIFLTPILVVMAWAPLKTAAGVSAAFILCNSLTGLAGHLTKIPTLPDETLLFCGVVLVGGALGSYLGANRFDSRIVHGILRIVLLTAGLKFLFVR